MNRQLQSIVDRWADRLVELSHSLHAEPETAFAEHRSARKIADLLELAGFDVTRGAAGLPTALVATRGTGQLNIGVCAEYDALPGIGHACGHNVNGAASVGAAIALGTVADELGLTVTLLGTPAEEDYAGKALLLAAGVFDHVAAAMMVHAAGEDSVGASSLAAASWDITFTGTPSHAATAPWEGVNALDAITLAHNALGLLRQQLPPGVLVHGIVTDGGHASNVIPARAAARYEVRARTLEQLHAVLPRVHAAFEAGSVATGAELDIRPRGSDYAELRQDAFMTSAYLTAARSLGRTVVERHGEPVASTDIGNVSHVLPTIQPTIGYPVGGAAHHTPEFARYGTSAGADLAVRDGALALGWVGVELATAPGHRGRLLDGIRAR
ncbi:amidohydrolase [Amycolatopsis sp. NBC_01480]|uniref:amidohydrolase n=1 Tax=Amycolatopsis sp. NBC_01480 TaxID=2903562 RepID=UPI002E2CE273|nr:amidohydrolase [Amycolatopsis sp. NBC_01480]